MGRDKLQLPFGETTILGKSAAAIREVPFLKKILVLSSEQKNHLDGFRVVSVPAGTPMHGSLRAGVSLLDAECEYFCVALADQPLLEERHFRALLEIWPIARSEGKDLVAPVNGKGERGNPCLIHRRYIPEILARADDDRGAHYLFQSHKDNVRLWTTEESAYFFDIDTKEDYQCAISNF